MKGPSERLKYDLRRVWECPTCKRRERTTGAVAFRHCSCQIKQMDGRQVVMKLVTDGVQRVGPPIVIQFPADAACDAEPKETIETVTEPVASESPSPAEDAASE